MGEHLRSRCARLLVLLLIVATFVNATAASAGRPTNADNRGVIAFIGDSNIMFGVSAIAWATSWGGHTDDGYTPVFISRVGASIRTPDCLVDTGCETADYWKIKLAQALPKIRADLFVTDLGINDSLDAGTSTTAGFASYGTKIDWFMGLLPTDRPVLWTNLPCSIEPPERLAACRGINTALRGAGARWKNLTVLNWAGVANSHPEYIAHRGTPTSVHYGTVGLAKWAVFVTRAIDANLPNPDGARTGP